MVVKMIDAVKENVPLSLILQAVKDDDFTFGNGILYDLCEKNKSHDQIPIVIAKVWLIGRSYAAAIERGRNNTDEISNDQFYRRAAEKIVKNKIDKLLSILNGFTSVTSENILSILSVFNKVENLFSGIAERGRISLTSKYLHFHFPKLFYIYDTRAKQGISKINKGYRVSGDILNGEIDIEEYERFFLKCFDLQEAIKAVHGGALEKKRHNKILTPRQLDRLLLEFQ
jgi:hypothetical protein